VIAYHLVETRAHGLLALYDVKTEGTSVAPQVRFQFANVGAPILWDPYYHRQWSFLTPEIAAVGGCSNNSMLPEMALQLYYLCFLDPHDPTKFVEASLDNVETWGYVK